MTEPKVTVIIPCYNAERYLAETINSVLAQTYDSFRIIAVNDGSSDNTAAILTGYSEKVTVLEHSDGKNHGQAAALNLGLSCTDSEYIAFIDADDLWHSDKLRKQVELLDNNRDVDLVYTNGHVIDADGNCLYLLFDKNHRERNRVGEILLDCYIRTPSLVMVRRSILQEAGAFTIGIIPDQDMWVRIKEIGAFHYLGEVLTSYREHREQVSSVCNNKLWIDSLLVLNMAMDRYPYPGWLKNKRLAVIHYRMGVFSIKVGRYSSAILHFLKSCWYDPVRAFKRIFGSRLENG
jgi:glycosyltransferase involved in cell wall biosynthesis